ncbi:hypothetical protein FQA39_LY08734 [Lamprigera yunnana]|nr:hypothetical protein FQA39_LY08734 [Lamprigera yunnana]
MKVCAIIVGIFAVASAARLENTYLPPSHAVGSGGQGHILNAPFKDASLHFGAVQAAYQPQPIVHHAAHAQPVYHQPLVAQPQYNILRYENVNDGFGSYSYGYDTENHINVHEAGQLKNAGTENQVNSVQGAYSYKGLNGEDYTVEYVADENGFQAKGAHLPTPPPIPEAILKSLELNAASANDNDDGKYREVAAAYNKQYIPPQKLAFDRQSGYHY